MKRVLIIMILLVASTIMSCTDAKMAKFGGLGDEFSVEMINCDGTVARSWTSTGKVSSEVSSDGYYFMDKDSGALIEVTGRIVITKL